MGSSYAILLMEHKIENKQIVPSVEQGGGIDV